MSTHRARPRSHDAAAALLAALAVSGPSLAWATRYAREGDPLVGAWARCDEPRALLLALASQPSRWQRAYDAWTRVFGAHSACGRGAGRCPACADAIRAVVPSLTLADFFAAARASRHGDGG